MPCPKLCKYTIQNGDSFWSIAYARNSDPATVQSLNPGVVATSLFPKDVSQRAALRDIFRLLLLRPARPAAAL